MKKNIDPQIPKNDNQDKSRNLIARLISLIFSTILLIAFAMYIKNNSEIIISLKILNIEEISILISLYILIIFFISLLNHRIIKKFLPKISILEIVSLQFINNFLNKLLPKGGVAYRGVYFKQKHKLSYSNFIASFAGLVIISLGSQSFLGLLSAYIVFLQTGVFNYVIFISLAVISSGMFFMFIVRPNPIKKGGWFFSNINKLIDGWKTITKHSKDIIAFLVFSTAILIFDSLSFYIIFSALNYPVSIFQTLILSSLSFMLTYINITPDGFGVREGAYLFISSTLIISEPMIVAASLIQRAIYFLASIVFSSISFVFLKKRK